MLSYIFHISFHLPSGIIKGREFRMLGKKLNPEISRSMTHNESDFKNKLLL